jgi:hypothetical protein
VKIKFKTKVRFYTFITLLSATILTTIYLSFIKTDNSTTLDHHYGKSAELIVERLSLTDWGRTSRGRKILSAFHLDEIRIVVPHSIQVNDKIYYQYDDDVINSASSGAMVKYQGSYTIYIGVYHISEIQNKSQLIRYMDYAIPEDEFIHVLIDELLSRHQRGVYFVDGEASWQEEIDAWNASEEAVRSYYSDDHYQVDGMSHAFPKYGPITDNYIEVK